ncbi:formate dehydrogenase accessory sulfurtransferase FdhD [Laceyella putida]|uniref:Sulfur carrier protein FdhD n=1 Tax=Laceyella putida TaxID=110101 RepID=A0ABW2RHG3_9BACL
MNISSYRTILKYAQGSIHEQEEPIVIEYPLTIVVNGEEFATLVCTPTHLEDMAIGFLASEGIIRFADELEAISIDERRGFAYVQTSNKLPTAKEFYAKRVIGSCCGKSRQSFYFYNDIQTAKTVRSKATLSIDQCFHFMRLLHQESIDFQQTGGVHNAILCNAEGILVARTDIGRHNTLDKIFGHWIRHPFPLRDTFIAFSGRVSSEVLLKVAKIGVGIILSKSAPTELALKMAEELGITIVGFIRGEQCNVYTHADRILL